ncbi:MAG: hypothetical protein ACR2QX_08230 [Woeseiaceae bacterium]
MNNTTHLMLILAAVVLAGCAEKGDNVYRTWVGPDRSNMAIVTLQLGPDVRDVTIRERELLRSEYGTIQLVPGKYTLFERDDANIGITIRPILVDASKARANGELILGHTYVLHAGKSDGKRALWIEDARSGEVFVDTR